MDVVSFGFIMAGVLLNAAGQLLLKAGVTALKTQALDWSKPWLTLWLIGLEWHVAMGLVCYVVSVGVWMMALARVPVSVAYPMLSIGYVVNAFAAYYLFGEALSAQKLIGIGVIVVGVIIVGKSL